MGSEQAKTSRRAARLAAPVMLLASAASTLLACGGVRRFPLHDPMWRDDDEKPFAPAPASFDSPFAWDGANQLVFRPISRFFAVDPAGPATDVNAFDEVPDSSWFTNRIGMHPMGIAEIVKGSCSDKVLDPNMPDGSWIIDQGKDNGANPGFRVNVPGVGKFMMKGDPDGEPERATGATSIASRMYHAAGFWAPCDSVVYFRPSLLKLKKGLTVTDNSGVSKPFDEKVLKKVLENVPRRGELVRMAASAWLPGRTIGPYTYEGVRDDDPNDVIPHEDRRELRGARLLAAWTNHFDAREQNTMNVFMPVSEPREKPKGDKQGEGKPSDAKEASDAKGAGSDPPKPTKAEEAAKKEKEKYTPGYVRHYIIDMGDCFGSVWPFDGVSERLGYAYYLDFNYAAEDFVTLGTIERPWERARREGGIFNYFSARDFDPEMWRPGYPNPAFGKMQEGDGAWMARILAKFTDPMVDALVKVGDYTDAADVDWLRRALRGRRDIILRRYLTRLSPVAAVHLVQNERLCGTDMAQASHVVAADSAFHYAARMYAGPSFDPLWSLHTQARGEGEVCVELAHVPVADAVPDSDRARYVVVDLVDGVARGPLRAHLYDLGPRRGFRLVGIERPGDVSAP